MAKQYNNYDKFPEVVIKGFDHCAWEGYDAILREINRAVKYLNKSKTVLVLDFYPGVYENEVISALRSLNPVFTIRSDDCAYDKETIYEMIKDNLTDDRVFGIMSTRKLRDFFSQEKLEAARQAINSLDEGLVLVYGVGAAMVTRGDILLYFDLARWEIQLRYRAGMGNWMADNGINHFLSKYKWGFFVEWRAADRHKKEYFSQADYFVDTNEKNRPRMVTGPAMRAGISQVSQRPFRVVPYFDPGVWGGQWMKNICNLDKDTENYAWNFNGVPEENSLYMRFGNVRVEVPAINLVFFEPRKLLGERVYGRFGTEFPIRFNFLDTMDGENLSLQVHPLTEYIQENFGMNYTQEESYYIMDCQEGAGVYLGLKENINREEMIRDLERAEKGEIIFPDHKYINKFPVKKHDHLLIPPGTIHCSGKNVMVLEISSSVYIFTFKLWDWGRVGLDGLPRPIHLKHGINNIQWYRDTKWVKENLINQFELLQEEDGIRAEKTGLHESEFIETVRHWFSKPVLHKTQGSVNVLNLVEGAEAVVESPRDAFEPFVVHYAETFIIPACVNEYIIRPYGQSEGKTIATIKAFVR